MLDLLHTLALRPLPADRSLGSSAGMSCSDHELVAFVDTQPVRFRCSLILSLCFPCAVFKMRKPFRVVVG